MSFLMYLSTVLTPSPQPAPAGAIKHSRLDTATEDVSPGALEVSVLLCQPVASLTSDVRSH